MTSSAPTTVRVSASSNRVEVLAVDGDRAFRVEGTADVDEVGPQVTISKVRSSLRISVATGTDLVIGTSSGRIEIRGHVGHLAIVTESGRVDVEHAESVDIRTESSRVEVGDVTGACRIRSTSGRVQVGSCGDADIAGSSGRIELRQVAGPVDAHSVSGRIEVALTAAYDVRAETVTGRIEVSLPKGTTAYQPPESAPETLRPPDCDCTVIARSTTGKVVVTSAMTAASTHLVGSVLFTDLVGFTEFNDVRGDGVAVQVLDHQRRLIDIVLGQHPGSRLVKELGDGLMVWCSSAATAVSVACRFAAGVGVERDAGAFPLAVRQGIHHGPVIERGSDIVGQTVNVAARIADLAGPSELLVSDEVLAACGDAHVGPVEAIGPVPVRGVSEPIWLHRIEVRPAST